MNKAIKAILTALTVLVFIPATLVLAAYGVNITVLHTGSSYDMAAFNVTANIDYMATNGYMNTSGNDTRVYLGTSALPYMLASDRILFAMPITANTSQTLLFNTGETELTDFDIISGYSANTSVGYYRTIDAANIELGDNFTVNMTAYIDVDPGATAYLLQKSSAFEIEVSGTGNITARILGQTEELLPTGAGDATGIPSSVGGAHWDCVNENYATPNDSDYVYTTAAAWTYDYYALADPSFSENATVDTITTYFREQQSGAAGQTMSLLRLGGTNELGTVRTGTVIATTYGEVIARPGGGDWSYSDYGSLQVGAGVTSDAVNAMKVTQASVLFDYHLEVTAESVADGEHEIVVSANTTHFWIQIDDVVEDIIRLDNSESVPDNGSNLIWNYINTMPYADNIIIEIDGVQQLYYDPVAYLVTTGSTANIPDRATGTANDGTIYWGSNPTGANITMAEMTSDYTSETISTTTPIDVAPPVVVNVIPVAEAVKLAAMQAKDPILYPLFSAINGLTTPGIPIMAMYEVLFLVLTMIAMFAFGRFGHMTLMVIAGWVIMGGATAWGVYDFPLMIMLVLVGVGFIWMQNRQGA